MCKECDYSKMSAIEPVTDSGAIWKYKVAYISDYLK